jgi:hypothetical protein
MELVKDLAGIWGPGDGLNLSTALLLSALRAELDLAHAHARQLTKEDWNTWASAESTADLGARGPAGTRTLLGRSIRPSARRCRAAGRGQTWRPRPVDHRRRAVLPAWPEWDRDRVAQQPP